MAVLVVGSIAFDTVETPFGEAKDELGGSAIYFSYAASLFCPTRLVGVVGSDFSASHLEELSRRGIDTRGVEVVEGGETFRWSGRYGYDLNDRTTLSTELNVFSDFHPKLPDKYRDSEYVFLANIDPELQLEVLAQMERPRLVACDTMNLWIETKRDALVRLLGQVDIVVFNDAEARQLTGEYSFVKAARSLHQMGCRAVVIKKGEHGCLLFTPEGHFAAPAYPLEDVFDPTGAGDSFAGGFMGYLAMRGAGVDDEALRRAVVFGSAVASFTVEEFGVRRIKEITVEDVQRRVEEFTHICSF